MALGLGPAVKLGSFHRKCPGSIAQCFCQSCGWGLRCSSRGSVVIPPPSLRIPLCSVLTNFTYQTPALKIRDQLEHLCLHSTTYIPQTAQDFRHSGASPLGPLRTEGGAAGAAAAAAAAAGTTGLLALPTEGVRVQPALFPPAPGGKMHSKRRVTELLK